MHLGKLQHPLLKLELNFVNYSHLIKFALSNCTWDPLSMLRLQMWRLSTHFLHMLFGRPHPDQKTETTQTNQKPQRECPHDGNNGPLFRLFGKLKNKNLRSINTKNKRWENAQTPHAQTLAHKQQQPMQTTNGKEMADCIPLRMVFHPLLNWLLMRVSTQMSAWRRQWAVVPINWKNSKIKTSDRWTLKTLRNAQTTNNNN